MRKTRESKNNKKNNQIKQIGKNRKAVGSKMMAGVLVISASVPFAQGISGLNVPAYAAEATTQESEEAQMSEAAQTSEAAKTSEEAQTNGENQTNEATQTNKTTQTVQASQMNTNNKEEVVYIMLDAEGNVDSVNVVNIFGKGEITDYGDYSRVKMLTSTNPISQDGDKITFVSDQDRLYYQGTLDNTQIPWAISIEYTLDGKKITPEELAGQSGTLEIHVKITENEKCKSSFYDSCALQASFALDTKRCENIVAEGATLANVGANKQISYTVLPGKGLDATIRADVTDFEMEAAAINGVKLNLDVEVNDADLMDQVDEIMDAAEQLDDGADELLDGANELSDGSGELLDGVSDLCDGSSNLKDGASDLYDGVQTLSDGTASLKDGIDTMQSGVQTVNGKSADLSNGSAQLLSGLQNLQSSLANVSVSTDLISTLTSGAVQISEAAGQLSAGASSLQASVSYSAYQSTLAQNGLDVNALATANTDAANTITAQISQLQASLAQITSVPGYENTEYAAQAAQLQAQIDSLTTVVSLLGANNAAISGTQTYFDSVSSGASSLASGLSQLSESAQTYSDGVSTAASQLSGLANNMESLKSGVNELVAGSQSLNQGIADYTGGVAQIAANFPQLADGAAQLYDGSSTLLDGAEKLKDGASDLYDGTEKLKNGATELDDGISSLKDGVQELKDGTKEFHEKTSDMDEQVSDKIDEMISSMSGSDEEVVSFVSDRNTNVDSVQFVIKTAAVKKADVVEEEPEEEAPKSFWKS